jgi:hypothetical protein
MTGEDLDNWLSDGLEAAVANGSEELARSLDESKGSAPSAEGPNEQPSVGEDGEKANQAEEATTGQVDGGRSLKPNPIRRKKERRAQSFLCAAARRRRDQRLASRTS